MAELPDYQERVTLGGGPTPGLQPTPLIPNPTLPDASAGYKALSGLGAELASVAEKLAAGQQETLASQAMEGFLQQRDALTDKYVRDPDYTAAEGGFSEEISAAKMEALATISDPKVRARTSLAMERDIISAGGKVRAAQLGRQADINIAANETMRQSSINEAVAAGSDAEREAAIGRYATDLQRLVKSGWMDAATAQTKAAKFRGELEQAEAYALVNRDPARARAMLADTSVWASLDPMKRQTLQVAAEQRLDANQQAAVTQSARFHPEAATLAMGRVLAPEHAARIFDNGIVSIESGGDNAAVSPKGALGASQIMPATAREVAAGLGLKDIAALSDAELKQRLTMDQALNLKLGRTYWSQMVTRYDGNVALAAAAYNAGPGRADAWHKAAEDKFGAGFTPAQLASVVDIKETRDYLGKLYGRYGAPMDVAFSSPAAAIQASNAVGAVLAQQTARETHLAASLASAAATSDPVVDIVRQGYDVDPQRLASWRAVQSAAAATGDAAAAGRLRDLDHAEKLQPLIRQAWATPPDQLDTQIKAMEAALTAPGGNPSSQALAAIKAFKAVQAEQAKRRDSEPVVLGGQDGGRLYAVEPLDGRNAPLDDTLTSALRTRDAQARTANRLFGGSGSPFTAEEAQAWQERYADAAPQERGQILGALAKGLSAGSFAAALPQIVKGENPKDARVALSYAARMYQADPAAAQSIIQGVHAQEIEKNFVPSSDANRQQYVTRRDALLPRGAFDRMALVDPRGAMAAMVDAVDARYAYLSSQAGDRSGVLNSGRLEQAVNGVTGGVVYHNGGPVIAPVRGMTQRDFDATIWGLKDEDLGGVQTTSGKPINAEYLRYAAKFRYVEPGVYKLQVNRDDANPQYAATREGDLFLIDLRGRPKVEPSRRDVSQRGLRAFKAELGDRLRAAAAEAGDAHD